MFGLGDIFGKGNHESILGGIGGKIQKWTDPIAMIPGVGDKWVNLTSNKIPELTNSALSKVMQPFEKVDKTINPLRKIPAFDRFGDLVADKPGDAIGTAIGAFFAAPAIGGALGGLGGGGAAGLGGAGGGGAGTLGAAGYGGGISSAGLPGIFGGASVAPSFGTGGGFLGGSLGTGSITGVSAPVFSSGGLLGSGGAGLFGGNGLSQQQYGQLIQQGINSMKPDQNQGTIPQQAQYQQSAAPTATVIPAAPPNNNALLLARLLAQR